MCWLPIITLLPHVDVFVGPEDEWAKFATLHPRQEIVVDMIALYEIGRRPKYVSYLLVRC